MKRHAAPLSVVMTLHAHMTLHAAPLSVVMMLHARMTLHAAPLSVVIYAHDASCSAVERRDLRA
jgi:hypothetical protein